MLAEGLWQDNDYDGDATRVCFLVDEVRVGMRRRDETEWAGKGHLHETGRRR